MKKTIIQIFSALLAAALTTLSAHAANAYYDNNGATAGSGNSSANWSTNTADWTYDATGSSATFSWTNGDSAIFSAGSDQTSAITVTTTSALTVSNITQSLGKVRIANGTGGGTLTPAGTSITISSKSNASGDYDLRIDPVLADSVSGSTAITKTGAGVLLLESASGFTGGFTLNGGSVGMETGGSVFGTGTLTLQSGNIEKSWGSSSSASQTVTNAVNITGTVNAAIVQGNAGNLVFSGPITGNGFLAVSNVNLGGALSIQNASMAISGDVSGFTGTFYQNTVSSGNGNALRFGSGSGAIVVNASNAKFMTAGSTSFNSPIALADANYGTFRMGELSGAGGHIRSAWNTSGNTTFEIGALGTSTTYAGNIDDNVNGSGGHAAVTKVGTGSLTLSGPNAYTLATTVENGSLIAGAAVVLNTAGPFGNASSAIALGDATTISTNVAMNPRLLIGGAFTMARTVTVGANNNSLGNAGTTFALGGSTANSSTFSAAITLNQSLVVTQAAGGTVTFSSPIGDGGLGLSLTNVGPGKTIFSAANTYTGNTVINGGTLVLSGSGLLASPNISIASGAVFDVSAQTTPTLAASQNLSGSGSVNGSLTTVASTQLYPGGNGTVGALTFSNNLILDAGSLNQFDLSSTYNGANDQIVLNGSSAVLTPNGAMITINSAGTLDTAHDYVLFNLTGGSASISGSFNATPNFVGTVPANSGSYTIVTTAKQALLRYTAPGALSGVGVASPASGGHGQSTELTVTVTPGSSPTSTGINVTVNLAAIGGSSTASLVLSGANVYTNTFTVAPGTSLGGKSLLVTISDAQHRTNNPVIALTVVGDNEIWTGGGSDDNFSTANNWGGVAPLTGDLLFFDGSTQTTPNLNASYSVDSVTFNSGASSFTITNTAHTLTLTGAGVTNNSGNPQTLNVPIVLSGAQTINAAAGNITLGGVVSGSANLFVAGANTVALTNANTYVGNTILNGGIVNLGAAETAGVSGPLGNSAAVNPGSIVFNGGTLQYSAVNTNDYSGRFSTTANQPVSIDNGGQNVTFATALTSSGGTLTASGTGTLTLAGNNTYSGITTVNNGVLAFNNSGSQTLGEIDGSGALIQIGSGTTALGAASYFSGGLTISNGTVTLGDNSAAGYGTITLAGGTFNNNAVITSLANSINVTGSNNVQAVNGKNFTLNGSITGNGIVHQTVNGSTAQVGLGGDNSGFTGTWIQDAGNTSLRFDSPNAGSASAAWVFNESQFSQRVRFNFGTGTINFGSMSGTTANGFGLANISSGTVTLSVGALNTSTTFAGTIEGNGANAIALTKVGTGTLTLSGVNAYSGGTVVNEGKLVLNSAQTGGMVTGALTVNDGGVLTVNVSGTNQLAPSAFTLGSGAGGTNEFAGVTSTNLAPINASALTLSGTSVINITSGTFVVGQSYPLITYGGGSEAGGGSVTLGSLPVGISGTLTDDGVSQIYLTVTSIAPEIWSGAASGTWDIASSINWKLSSAATNYIDGSQVLFDDSATGTTTITNIAPVSPSSITFSNSSKTYRFAGGAIGGSGSLTLNSNGKVILANTNTYTGGTTISAGTLQLGDGVANNGVVAGGITDNAKLVVANPADQTFAGSISGTGAVIKTNASVLTLGATNVFAGGLVIQAGTVSFANANALGTGTTTLGDPVAGADAKLLLTTAAVGLTNPITSAGGAGARSLTFPNGTTVSGLITLSNNLTAIKTGNGDCYVPAALAGPGNLVVSNNGTGYCWVNGPSSPSWTGGLIVGAGTVAPGGTSQLNTNTVLSIASSGNLNNANNSFTVAGLNDILGATGGGIGGGYANPVLTLGGTGNYSYSGNYSGPGWLTVSMASGGVQALSGTNFYTGRTTVNSGTLLVNGSIASAVSVNGGTLGGTGTVSNSVTVNSGGTLSPGASIGTLTIISNVTLNAGSTNVFEVNGSTLAKDVIAAGGTVTYGGVLNIVPTGSFTSGQKFTLFSGNGTTNASNFASITGSPGSRLNFSFTNGVLSVVAAGPSGLGVITNSVTGSTLNLTWPSGQGWTLEAQTNSLSTGLSATGWGPVSGAADGSYSITIDATKPTVFYRLVYP